MWKEEINPETTGEFVTRFAELLHHIWNRGGRTYAPHWMMRMLTEVHSEFKGGNQHDAHDCLI